MLFSYSILEIYYHFLDLGGLIAEGASAVQAKGRHGLSQSRHIGELTIGIEIL